MLEKMLNNEEMPKARHLISAQSFIPINCERTPFKEPYKKTGRKFEPGAANPRNRRETNWDEPIARNLQIKNAIIAEIERDAAIEVLELGEGHTL